MNAVLEKANELPDGWEIRDLEDVLQVIRGISFKSSEKLHEPGKNTVVCLRTANVQESVDWSNLWWVPENFVKRDEQFIREHDILMSNANSYELVGKVSLVRGVPEKATLGAFITMLRARDDVDPRFFFYQLRSSRVVKEIRSRASTTTNISNVSTGKLKDIPLWVAPLEQQKRIVAKIEELFSHIDAGIEALKKAKQLLKQYRQSVLKAAVTGELTKEWREANKDKLEPASQLLERILKERRQKWEEQQLEQFKAKGKLPKDDKWKDKYKEPVATRGWEFLSEIPDSWSWVSMDQIGDSQDQPVLTGPFGSNLGKEDFTQDGVPVLTIGCLQEEGIDLSRAMHVSKNKAEELDRYQLKEGDMLFSRMAAVGRAGFVTPELEGALFNYHIMRLRLHTYAMLQEYFVHYVRGSSQVYDYVKEVNHGATRDGINTQQLLEMPVALAPLQEQKEICKVVSEKLGAIRRLESEIDIQLLKADKNKQSVLASSFTGKLITTGD